MARFEKIPDTKALIPASVFEMLPYWGKFPSDEKKEIEKESQELARAQFMQGASKMEMGKHLVALRALLQRYGVFVAHLKNFTISERTAYRYIEDYENAKKKLPEAALSIALVKGIDLTGSSPVKPFGKYTPVMKKLPPPKTNNTAELHAYWNEVEEKMKEYRSQVHAGIVVLPPDHNESPQVLLKEAYRFSRIRMKRISNAKGKTKFVHELAGMLLADLGVSGGQTIEAQTAPEDFKQGRGYPKGRPRKFKPEEES